MIIRFVFLLLLFITTALFSCSQPKVDCDASLAKSIDTNISVMVKTIRVCGDFSGDDTLLLQGTILGVQLIQLAKNETVTYRDIIAKLNEIRHSQNYPMILEELKRVRNSSPSKVESKPNTISFIEMTNYKQAISGATHSGKPLFIFFTSKYSVAARKMEEGLLADNDVKKILSRYERYTADAGKPEIENLQMKEFNSQFQPYFVIVINERKVAEFSGYTKDKDEFIHFLEKGLK